MTAEPWVGVPEVALHFHVGRDTVRRRANAGEIPGTRFGRQWRFRIADIEAHLKTVAAARDPWARTPASRRALGRRRAA